MRSRVLILTAAVLLAYATAEAGNIWPWRDGLMGAVNRSLPDDQLTIQQLAGDLLPNATPDQIVELESRAKGNTPEFEAELHAWEADAMRPIPWQPLPAAAVAAQHGSTLTALQDHSIRASGVAPPSETCTVRVKERLSRVTAFRLEALPDDSLPMRGPGRGADGNAVVTDFRVQIVAGPPNPATKLSPNGLKTVVLKDATADFSASGFGPSMAIDDDSQKTGWSFAGGTGAAHVAVFQTTEPLTVPPDAELVFSIAQSSGKSETLGRFRLSATSAPPPIRELDAKIRTILALEPSEREPAQRETLANYFRPLSKTIAHSE